MFTLLFPFHGATLWRFRSGTFPTATLLSEKLVEGDPEWNGSVQQQQISHQTFFTAYSPSCLVLSPASRQKFSLKSQQPFMTCWWHQHILGTREYLKGQCTSTAPCLGWSILPSGGTLPLNLTSTFALDTKTRSWSSCNYVSNTVLPNLYDGDDTTVFKRIEVKPMLVS